MSPSKLRGGALIEAPDVVSIAKPQLTAVGEPSDKAFGDEQTGATETCSHNRCIIEHRPRIEDSEDLGMGVTDAVTAGLGQPFEGL